MLRTARMLQSNEKAEKHPRRFKSDELDKLQFDENGLSLFMK